MIVVDRFPSASGLWTSALCSSYEPCQTRDGVAHVRAWFIAILTSGTHRVRKLVRIGWDDPTMAYLAWERWKQVFGYPRPGAVYETDGPSGLAERQISPPILIEEDLLVLKWEPCGGQIFVREITPVDEVTARAEAAGLHAVVSDDHIPPKTTGIILKLGEDPLLHEKLRVGYIVMFSRFAGSQFTEAGNSYRHIQYQHVIGFRRPEDGIDDILPATITEDMIRWANDLKQTLDIIASRKVLQPLTTRTVLTDAAVMETFDGEDIG
jgi:hypothetical protein